MEQKITAVTTYDAEAAKALMNVNLRRFYGINYAFSLAFVLLLAATYLWSGAVPLWYTLYCLIAAIYFLFRNRHGEKRFLALFEKRELEVNNGQRTYQCEFTDACLIRHNNQSGETRNIPYAVLQYVYDLPNYLAFLTQAKYLYLIDKRTLENTNPDILLAMLKEKNTAIKYENLATSRRHLRSLLIPAAMFLAFLVFRYFYFMCVYLPY